ncbi:MAG: sel1 repeat family protein [Treponema sp.]|nr:sel1 repeat family protein [Treponema sp.]
MKTKFFLFAAIFLIMWTVKVVAESSNSDEQDIKQLTVLAKKGNSEAQYELGQYYTKQEEYSKALKWYSKAAEKNHAKAQLRCGDLYLSKDKRKEALNWYEKSFSNGEILAASRLGTMYKFFFKDVEGAKNWYQKGAEKVMKLVSGCWEVFMKVRKILRMQNSGIRKLLNKEMKKRLPNCRSFQNEFRNACENSIG